MIVASCFGPSQSSGHWHLSWLKVRSQQSLSGRYPIILNCLSDIAVDRPACLRDMTR